jgi:PAS domain S-box-containing protein
MDEAQKLNHNRPRNFSEVEQWLIHSCLAPAAQQMLREAKEKGTAKRPGRFILARQSYFCTLAEEAPVGIFFADARGRFLYVNRQFHTMTGLPRNEMRRDGWIRALHPDDHDHIVRRWHEAIATQKSFSEEFRLLCPDGRVYWVFCQYAPIYDETSIVTGYVGTLSDLTQQKHTQSALTENKNAFARQLLHVQEEERRRIARELHDEMGQMLTVLKLELQGLQREPASPSIQLEESLSMVDLIMSQMRTLLADLRPVPLETLGLPAALHWYLNRQGLRSGVKIHFHADTMRARPPAEIEICCFRIVQESITNALRHARAHNITVELRCEIDALCIQITDDGVGFNVAAARSRAAAGVSLGLLGMYERANLAGGHLSITSATQQGTVVTVRFPFSLQEELSHVSA